MNSPPQAGISAHASRVMLALAECAARIEPELRAIGVALARRPGGDAGARARRGRVAARPRPAPERPPTDLDRERARRAALRHNVELSEKPK